MMRLAMIAVASFGLGLLAAPLLDFAIYYDVHAALNTCRDQLSRFVGGQG